MLIVSVWPMKLKGDRAMSMWTLLVTMLIGDWRNPPHFGNWVAQWLGSKRHKQEKQQHHQILGFTDHTECCLSESPWRLPPPPMLAEKTGCLPIYVNAYILYFLKTYFGAFLPLFISWTAKSRQEGGRRGHTAKACRSDSIYKATTKWIVLSQFTSWMTNICWCCRSQWEWTSLSSAFILLLWVCFSQTQETAPVSCGTY